MKTSQKPCRLCLSQTDFNVSLFGTYCRRTNIVDKILVCLKLVIEDGDYLDTICYKCADNIENYHQFMMSIKKCQMRYSNENWREQRTRDCSMNKVNMPHAAHKKEQVYDADYTFSFLEVTHEDEVTHTDGSMRKETKVSRQFFSFFSPSNVLSKQSKEPTWKISKPRLSNKDSRTKIKPYKVDKTPRNQSRDLFNSQSQDVDEVEPKAFDWKLTPNNNIIKRIREKCFGRCDF